jgi:two-component system sensor histidine kinase/response regulator
MSAQPPRPRGDVDQMRDDLVQMLVHDMRNHLTILIANLQLAKMDARGAVATSIDQAIRGGKQLNELANTVLDVSRLEEGRMPITLVATDVAALARSVRAEMVALEPDRAIEVSESGATTCMCDTGLIRRVLENLVSNAIKHTPSGGAVHIAVMKRPAAVRIEVRDEGGGVPAEARDRIFEKFGAVAVRGDSLYHSAGLGLAFCKLAVEAHGGTIAVEDASPSGSVFVAELPC